MERLQAILPLAAAADPAALDVRPENVAITGWRILSLLTAAVTLQAPGSPSLVAASLADGWKVRTRPGRRLIEMALILCADHELNVSAFAARVVASTGSSPYDVVGAGLGALRGPRHGDIQRGSRASSMNRARPPACVACWRRVFVVASRRPDLGTRSIPMVIRGRDCCSRRLNMPGRIRGDRFPARQQGRRARAARPVSQRGFRPCRSSTSARLDPWVRPGALRPRTDRGLDCSRDRAVRRGTADPSARVVYRTTSSRLTC